MTTRSGARAGKASWRSKHAGLTEGGNTPTRGSFGFVTASTSSLGKACCSHTWTPPGTTRYPQQPTRSKARMRLRQMLRDHRGMRLTRRIKAVFWWHSTHSAPPASSDNPGHHAHRRSPRKHPVSRQPNPPSHRHHPRLGRRNLLERTHHTTATTAPGTNPRPTRFVL